MVLTVVAGTVLMLLSDDDPQPWPVQVVAVPLEDADADAGVDVATDGVHAPPVVVVTVTVAVDFELVSVLELAVAVDDVVVVVVVLLLPPPIFNPLIASQSAMPAPTGIALVKPPTTVPLIIPYGLVALTLHTHQLFTPSKLTVPSGVSDAVIGYPDSVAAPHSRGPPVPLPMVGSLMM